MKVCSVDGCGKKHVARGLCATHYNQQHQPNRHAKVEVPCTQCGAMVVKTPSAKRRKPFCDYACRDAYRSKNPYSRDRLRLAQRAVTTTDLVKWEPPAPRPTSRQRKPRFVAGTCICGASFIADRLAYHGHAKHCSPFCSSRTNRKERRAKESGAAIHWTQLAMRDGMNCHLCGDACDPEDFTREGSVFLAGITYPSVDHVVPLARGGTHSLDNVRLAHMLWNSLKSDSA